MKLVTVCTLGVALALSAGAAQAQGQGQGQGRPGFGGGRGPGGPGGFGFFGGGGGMGFLLQMPEVQTELKIDAAQKELLLQINQENREKMRQLFQQVGFGQPGQGGGAPDPAAREEFQKKMAAMQADQTKQIGEVLDAKQMARLKQLSLQREGTRALTRPEVQDQLKLSADQRQKLVAAFNSEREAMQALFQNRPQDGQPPSEEQRAEFGKKMQAARANAEASALAVLTDAQKNQFKSLQGAPFKFPEGGFGGPGGFGRPGGQRPNNN